MIIARHTVSFKANQRVSSAGGRKNSFLTGLYEHSSFTALLKSRKNCHSERSGVKKLFMAQEMRFFGFASE